MGDTRQKGCMIPISFEVMWIFEDDGFKLKELIIKEQYNCKATGYWKTNSVKYNFLLIAHEYLFVFRKWLHNPLFNGSLKIFRREAMMICRLVFCYRISEEN